MIDDKILELSREVSPKYLQNYDNFQPGKDYIMYSGQLWDENELTAAIKSLLTGKWISAGEKVEQFQI
jgi:hypothetical protein